MSVRSWITQHLARYLSEPLAHYELRGRNDPAGLTAVIRKGDVLLVEGDQRVSAVIKYLTQSSWSHAALYIGDELLRRDAKTRERALTAFGDQAQHLVVEALMEGVVASPLVKYIDYNVRLCRPHRLRNEHLKLILDDAVDSIGLRYDMRNILDLAVHLLAASIFPASHREERLRLGSGISGHVICTSLLGRFFHKVGFPVLPSVTFPDGAVGAGFDGAPSLWSFVRRRKPRNLYAGLYRRRHPTLLTPRDFDLSPFFQVVKFNVVPERGFDYSRIEWAEHPADDLVASAELLDDEEKSEPGGGA
jgi:hypothetical protein